MLYFSTELFDNYMQQDAHEFLNYLLNTIADLLQGKLPHIMACISWTFFPNIPFSNQEYG